MPAALITPVVQARQSLPVRALASPNYKGGLFSGADLRKGIIITASEV